MPLDDMKQEIEKYRMTSGVTNQGTWNECLDCVLHTINDYLEERSEDAKDSD